MKRAVAIAILVLVAAGAALVYKMRRTKDFPANTQRSSRKATDSTFREGESKDSFFVSIDSQHPEFAERVLPIVRDFFATLERAGVNPLEGELRFSRVQIHHGRNGMVCRFVIGDSWSAITCAGPKFSGIMHFGERGPDNPFRAISHANTNALIRLSERAIKMPQAEAQRIIKHISDTFAIDHSDLEKPEIYPEKMFHYDLGMYTAQYRKKGSDPINGLNYPITFSIRATSPTTAVVVMYSASGDARFKR